MKLLAQTKGTLPLGALSAPGAYAPTDYTPAGAVKPLGAFLSMFIGFLTTLAGLMFLIYIIIAGLNWISSGGDKGKVEKAREQMTQGALGLIVVIAGYAIVGIVGRVFGLDILNPGKVIMTLIPTNTTAAP